MATMMCLTDEVIAIILGYNDITIQDISNFRRVCKKFRLAAKYEKFEEKKFSQRWPIAKKIWDKKQRKGTRSKENEKEQSEENKLKLEKSFTKTGIKYVKKLRSCVSIIVHEHCEKIRINNSKKFDDIYLDKNLEKAIDKICCQKFMKYSFFIDEMKSFLAESPRGTGYNLTERYCITKMLQYIREKRAEIKLFNFQYYPREEQILERTATIVAQWFQPKKHVSYSYVKASLDSIAAQVMNWFREDYPDHSIFSTPDETLSYWRNNNIEDNQWNEAEAMQIMSVLQKYIFGVLNFRQCLRNTNFKTMCIENVLKNRYGHQVVLLIIYHSVARRLGLRCDVILSSEYINMYCIFWKPTYATNSLENAICFNLYQCCYKEYPDCIRDEPDMMKELEHVDNNISKVRRMSSRNMFNFFSLRFGYDKTKIIMYERWITQVNVDDYEVRLLFQNTEQFNPRPKDVKFAVGMIVTHNHCTDNYTGVIMGWYRYDDKHIKFYIKSSCEHIKFRMLPRAMTRWRNLKFEQQRTIIYIILIENNRMCYVREDDITLTTPRWIENCEIGRYFCTFEGTHYVPNKMLAELYPQDAAVTAAVAAISVPLIDEGLKCNSCKKRKKKMKENSSPLKKRTIMLHFDSHTDIE